MNIRVICLIVFVAIISIGLAFDVTSHLLNVIAGVAGVAGLVYCALTLLGKDI